MADFKIARTKTKHQYQEENTLALDGEDEQGYIVTMNDDSEVWLSREYCRENFAPFETDQ